MNTALSELRRKHGTQFGVPEDRVELVRLDLEILTQMGTFVRVYAGGLTMFTSQATWLELGVPEESVRPLRYRRPPRYLIDPDEIRPFRNDAQRVRDALDAVGIKVEFMYPYRWVGYRDWSGWLEQFREIQAEWEARRRERLIDRYDQHLRRLVDDFTRSAEEAYTALQAARAEDLPPRDDFVEGIVARTLARMPTPRQIEEKLVLEYFTPAIATPSLLEEELLRQERIRHRRELERERAAIRRQEEMFRQRLERYRQMAESLQTPLEQVLDALLREVDEAVQGTLEVLRTHGGLRGRASERLRSLASRVQMLEDLGNRMLLDVIREAAALTRPTDDESDDQAAARVDALGSVLKRIGDLVGGARKGQASLDLVAQEVTSHTWRSVCLDCHYVWESQGSAEPVFCPRCKSNRVASRQTG
ncbi:MAG TPA: hypothetical protein EYH30_10720 [Anaerolineales bacterium]|nr:hypothetical protein [Anaerolineales bacterium]